MRRFHWIVLLILAFPGSPLLEARQEIQFKIIADVESQAITFLKDRDGFIWIGTYVDGVYRFDGKTLKHYVAASDFITGNNVPAIIEDRQGMIWFASSGGGLTRYDKETDTSTHFRHHSADPDGLSSDTFFWAGKQILLEDSTGDIWLGTLGGGLNRLDRSRNRFIHYKNDSQNPGSISNDNVRSIYEDRSGDIWVGTEFGLNRFDRQQGEFIRYLPDAGNPASLSGAIVMSIFEDASGRLWVGTESSGLNRFDRESGTFTRYRYHPKKKGRIVSDRITHMFEDDSGRLWVSHEERLSIYDSRTDQFTKYGGSEADITMLLKDPESDLYMALYDSGKIGVHNPHGSKFKLYRPEQGNPNSLPSEIVVTIYEDREGMLWIATLGGLTRYDRVSETFTHFLHEPGNPASIPSSADYTPGLLEDSSGTFWVGGALPATLSILNRKTRKVERTFVHEPENPFSMPDAQQVNAIIEDKDDPELLWLATAKGLVKFNRRTERFFTYGRNDSWNVLDDGFGFLWISTWGNGIARFNKANGAFTYFRHDPDDITSISANVTVPLFIASDGEFWVGSENGLNLFDPESGTFASFKRSDGYPWDAIHSIGEDRNGNLWLGTNSGLAHFNTHTGKARLYTKEDGLQGAMFYANNGITTANGEMWFGGTKGMNSFFPDEIHDNPHLPRVRLTAVRQGGSDMDLGKAPERIRAIHLDWRHNFFEFEFAAFDYANPAANQYAYMLKGLDNDWYYAGTQNFGRYAIIPPGTYQLRLKGANNDGVWNDAGDTITVVVTPPLWKTGWFYTVMGLIAILLITAVVFYLVRLNSEIKERKRSEAALKVSEKKYRELFTHLPDVYYRTDADGCLTMVSPSFKTVVGYELEEAIGKPVAATFYADPTDGVRLLEQIREKTKVEDYQIRLVRKDGKIIWISTNSRFYHDDNGEMLGVEGIFRDITPQKQAEEMRDRLATAIEQAAEFIVITDPEGAIQYVNPAFEAATGYTLKEVKGENPRILKSGKHNAGFYRNLWATITAGEVWKGRLTNRRKDGSFYEEEATITPVRDHAGHIVNYVAVKRDVTREVKLEEQLIQAQKMESIGTLAGGIAHDFNNILSAIIGYTEIGICDTDDEGMKENLHKVMEAGGRAKDLVNQILTFSRQSEVQPKPVKVMLIVREALKLLRASLPTTIDIQQQINSESLVMADPTQIHQVLMNLCSNAGHAMRERGGTLRVGLDDVVLDDTFAQVHPIVVPGEYLRLTVSDSGVGMPKAVMDRIFDPFFTTKEKGEGTGMGLSVVHGIVRQYRGTITVESNPGQGTGFSIYFPVFHGEAAEVPMETDPLWVGTERILFVDDEAFQVDLGKRILERLGYQVEGETNSLDALERFRSDPHRFDLVVTDMTMPRMTGDLLSGEILAIRPDIPVIICTGYSEQMTEEKAAAMGIKGFVMKPVVMRQLAMIVRDVLDE